jgi:hypothetical protein
MKPIERIGVVVLITAGMVLVALENMLAAWADFKRGWKWFWRE